LQLLKHIQLGLFSQESYTFTIFLKPFSAATKGAKTTKKQGYESFNRLITPV